MSSVDNSQIPVVILCGGQGTRLREETEYRPKPLVEIGPYPILWHRLPGTRVGCSSADPDWHDMQLRRRGLADRPAHRGTRCRQSERR